MMYSAMTERRERAGLLSIEGKFNPEQLGEVRKNLPASLNRLGKDRQNSALGLALEQIDTVKKLVKEGAPITSGINVHLNDYQERNGVNLLIDGLKAYKELENFMRSLRKGYHEIGGAVINDLSLIIFKESNKRSGQEPYDLASLDQLNIEEFERILDIDYSTTYATTSFSPRTRLSRYYATNLIMFGVALRTDIFSINNSEYLSGGQIDRNGGSPVTRSVLDLIPSQYPEAYSMLLMKKASGLRKN